MTFFDISCPLCGSFHAQAKHGLKTCPECGDPQAVIAKHDFAIDARFREERNNMLERMDLD